MFHKKECSGKKLQFSRKTVLVESFLNKVAAFNPSSANPPKWSNPLKQFVGFCRRIVLSVFDHFVKLALKGLTIL